MDFYFTNQKVKKKGYSLHFLDPEEYRYFLIELTVIFSKINKTPTQLVKQSEWDYVVSEIKKNEILDSIFNKLKVLESSDFISCEVFSDTLTGTYYYFEY